MFTWVNIFKGEIPTSKHCFQTHLTGWDAYRDPCKAWPPMCETWSLWTWDIGLNFRGSTSRLNVFFSHVKTKISRGFRAHLGQPSPLAITFQRGEANAPKGRKLGNFNLEVPGFQPKTMSQNRKTYLKNPSWSVTCSLQAGNPFWLSYLCFDGDTCSLQSLIKSIPTKQKKE